MATCMCNAVLVVEKKYNPRGCMLQEKVINDVLLADQPSKKFVRPEEIGALVRHLCSDDAQSFQGACISIDGGWTAR